MSNERINLTQFEEMIEGPWSANWYPAEEGVEPDFLIQGGAEGHKVTHVSTAAGIILAYVPNGEEALAGQIAKLPELIAELKRMYEREEELMDILTTLEDRQGVEIPCSHNWITEDEYYTYQGKEWILRNVHCEYCLDDNNDLGFDQTVEDFQKASE